MGSSNFERSLFTQSLPSIGNQFFLCSGAK
jgi:hypothetical protein